MNRAFYLIYSSLILLTFGFWYTQESIHEQRLWAIVVLVQCIILLLNRFNLSNSIPSLGLFIVTSLTLYPITRTEDISHLQLVVLVFGIINIYYLLFESLVQKERKRTSITVSVLGYVLITICGLFLLTTAFSFGTLLFVGGLYLSFIISYIDYASARARTTGIISLLSLYNLIWLIFFWS